MALAHGAVLYTSIDKLVSGALFALYALFAHFSVTYFNYFFTTYR
jgi:hypothetical protein